MKTNGQMIGIIMFFSDVCLRIEEGVEGGKENIPRSSFEIILITKIESL